MVSRVVICILLFCPSVWAADSGALRDPLRPLGYKVPPAASSIDPVVKKQSDFRLGAVLIANDRAVAVINGQSLQVGETLDGFKLVSIEADKVLLKKEKEEIVLRRSGTGLKKTFVSADVEKGIQP